MESESHSFAVGSFVLLMGLAVVGGVLWLEMPAGPRELPIDLVTRHSVAGLKVDAPVRLRGVDVGRVASIIFDPHERGQIRVRITVDPAAPLTQATFAQLSYQGINGLAMVQLDDDHQGSHEPLRMSVLEVPQMELRAGLIEQAEQDVRSVLLGAARVESRIEVLLSPQNVDRMAALVDSLHTTSEHYARLASALEPGARALPGLLGRDGGVQTTVEKVAKLAQDIDQKLTVLDSVTVAARQVARAADGLNRDTLPRLDALLDEVSVDARELKRPLHEVSVQPQSLIFGSPLVAPGPGEPGFGRQETHK
jgi:phospholipid/cholesterol/gamma-HCH transport system substrate-binding protein